MALTPFTIYIGCGFCGGDLSVVTRSPYDYEGPNRENTTVLQCRHNGHHLWVFRAELMKAPIDDAAAERQRKHREKARRKAAVDPREELQRVAS